MLLSASVNSISSIPSPSVPVEEGLALEHGGELVRDALEQFLDGGGVADERGGHLESLWWDVADGRLDVVGDPLHKVGAVLALDVQHLFIHLLHADATTEDGRRRSGIFRDGGRRQPSCSWHQTFAASAQSRSRRGSEADPRAVRGAKPTMKKWRRGKGTMLTASLRKIRLS